MDLPDIEVVAAAVHDAWMAQKREKGVISAPSQQTGEEQMRPYGELSDEVKEYDRATVRTVYDAIQCANPRCDSFSCAKHDEQGETCKCGPKSAPLVQGAVCRRCHKPTALPGAAPRRAAGGEREKTEDEEDLSRVVELAFGAPGELPQPATSPSERRCRNEKDR